MVLMQALCNGARIRWRLLMCSLAVTRLAYGIQACHLTVRTVVTIVKGSSCTVRCSPWRTANVRLCTGWAYALCW